MNTSNRLHHHVAHMVAFEKEFHPMLIKLTEFAADHSDAKQLMDKISSISESHLETLRSRLSKIADKSETPESVLPKLKLVTEEYPVSSALQQTSSILNSAIIGYAMLISISKRYRDSIFIGEGNTDDLAQLHTKNYVNAEHKVNQLINNVVLWELNSSSDTCQCSCPSCTLGICLCSQAPRLILSNFWAEQGPISTDSSVFIHTPRPGSAADLAGLHHGDTIVAADGQTLDSHFALQGAVQAHESGEKIDLKVKRHSGELENLAIAIP